MNEDTSQLVTQIKKIIKKLYTKELSDPEQKDKFLEVCNVPKLNHEEEST